MKPMQFCWVCILLFSIAVSLLPSIIDSKAWLSCFAYLLGIGMGCVIWFCLWLEREIDA